MEFVTATGPMDRLYYSNPKGYLGDFNQSNQPDIEQTIGVKDIGMSVTEGARFGTLVQTSQNAIRMGAGKIELATAMGGGHESVGAEAYGKDARQALREMFRANQVDVVSVHTPVQVGNLSGYNPQERGFTDEYRKMGLDEVKRAIDFAADVNGGAVVFHSGEYQRDISDQPWAKNPDGSYKFLNYAEEPGRAVLYMVDNRTGRLITEVRKSMVVREPRFKTRPDPSQGGRERWVDANGQFIDESNPDSLMFRQPEWDDQNKRFETQRMTWDDFVRRADEWNKYNRQPDQRKFTPEELFFRSQIENRILQSRGYSLYHGRFYEREKRQYEALKKAYDFYSKMEGKMSPDEQWQLLENDNDVGGYLQKFVPNKTKNPSQLLKEALEQSEMSLRHTHESSAAADAQAEESIETMKHVVPVSEYAKQQSARSYAEAGIYAMERSHKAPHAKKDIFIAPENLFPEMGYGAHPEELIQLVKNARKEMVTQLTSKMIPDPHEQRRDEHGNLREVPNPNYDPGMTKARAEQEARQHIRATLDTQHLGMWWKHFQPLPGEGKEQRKKRFDKWYMDQIKKLEEEDIIGHIHVVDAYGGQHSHLPVGQGTLPVRQALEYLKKKGYKGTMISEAYGEESMFGSGRILTEAWRGLGTPIRGYGAPQRWSDLQHSYFGVTQNPYFIFGAYSPSNDWQLWSQVPME